ncbi:hypothetical protein EUGRSUZ_F02005 [Eucalyptus grandis]|uniref:Uncharacterized protein n=2 Tax=Eucalyptus grandis TaxID=71139 RepID=A0ACC3KG48_EUCGR|nr:hypothetical protein EUGRSUZ_F02005 [Eucalyptus grandis]
MMEMWNKIQPRCSIKWTLPNTHRQELEMCNVECGVCTFRLKRTLLNIQPRNFPMSLHFIISFGWINMNKETGSNDHIGKY